MFMEMASLDCKGCDIIVEGIDKLPETYRRMIHGEYIGKPIIKLWDKIGDEEEGKNE